MRSASAHPSPPRLWMKTMHDDTSPAARTIQHRVYRAMTGAERFQIAIRLSREAREFALARLRRHHPDWSDRDLKRELLRIALLPRPLPPDLR